jgi:hypothetical protein
MKIAIITCSRAQSYGAVLQTYASQTFLEKLGHNVEIIDYAPSFVTKSHKITYVGDERLKKNPLKKWMYIAYTGLSRYKRNKMFIRFLSDKLNLTKIRYSTYEELCNNPPLADHYICGSDQIWNVNYPNGWDKSYYLGFVKNGKKHSYAASLALKKESLPTNYNSFVTEQLRDFSSISVREDIAVDIIQPLVKQTVQHVLDPVFLLDREDWDSLESQAEQTVEKDGYILIMPMGDGNNVFRIAECLKEQIKIPVYNISFSQRRIEVVDKQFNACSPYMFLRLIKNARVVITNSFHGTAFSIIYGRDFLSCDIPGTSSRIESLLRSFCLENHLISKDFGDVILAKNSMKASFDDYDLTKFSRKFMSNITASL